MNTRFYDGLRRFLRPVYALFRPGRVTGMEHIPTDGPFMLCANHIHWRDPLFLAVRLPERRYTYLGKAELFENRFTARILGDRGLGGIPIHRGHSDLNAVRQSLQVLREGKVLGVFPQGTRSRDNTPTPMLNGAAMIAIRAGVPIVPVYIDGPYRLFRRVDVSVGAPVDISDLGTKYDAATLDEVTHRIERAIWSMQKKEKA